MGPIALFDKSFLQSLSLDEAVWFDQFFLANISPLFYIETLADLDKELSRGKTAEQVVGNIAEKAPQMSGVPNISHLELLLANLMGQPVSMTNRPVIGGGRQVVSEGKRGVNFDVSPEAKAFLISKFLQLKSKNQDIHGQKAHTGHLITKESSSWP